MASPLPSGSALHLVQTEGARRGLVIVPDIGGLRPLFTDMADALAAEHGWSVATFEPWPGREHLTLEERLAAVGSLDDSVLLADVAAAADALEVEPVAVMGFCLGGMVALKAAAAGRLDRAVSFYGMVRLPDRWRSETMGEPLDALASGSAPVLSLVGTEDPWVPAADADALAATGAEVVRYPAADHGFVHDPSRPAHRPDDAADAWRRTIAFLTQVRGRGGPARPG
ncbi:dienelactone hydrolase family protein [soil metagenome]